VYGGDVTGTRWLDDDQQRAWRSYLRMQGKLSAHLNRRLQTDSDISLADFDVLVHLTDAEGGRMRVLELARVLDWEKSRASHHLARMQRRGLITREECTEDKRGAFVVLTREGQRVIEEAAPQHVEVVRRVVFDDLTPEQVEMLTAISRQVLDNLESE
jgi:DNA-binding MarR family transcriptional regulator